MLCPYCGYDNKLLDTVYNDNSVYHVDDIVKCEKCSNTFIITSDMIWTDDYGYIEIFGLKKISYDI